MAQGSVVSINVSRGGVPKHPVLTAYVDANGVEGDAQKHLDIHGGPERAVCLYSLEVIEALRAEGHPIAPGTAGENLTLSGIDWQAMLPGARIEIGDVLLEVTRFTSPCKAIGASFRNGEFVRISQKVHPGWSRVYARVLNEGTVSPGSPAILVALP